MDNPNIIFILADDMGFGDVGSFNPNSKIPTPNMDRLASEGMRFTDAHSSSSVCTPSRYSIMTGRYCWRTDLKQGVIGGYSAPLIEPGRLTVASMLRQQGYHTACIGKWHIGATFHDANGTPTTQESQVDLSQPVTGGPTEVGFDYAYWNSGCGTCAPPYGFIENDHFENTSFSHFEPGSHGPVGVGAFGQWGGMMADGWDTKETDVIIADKACEYIGQRVKEETPFFLFLTPNAPHEPCLEQFVPEFARGKSDAGARGDLVWLFDWTIGRVVETLEEHGLKENTMIVVSSDNGALPGDFVLDDNGQRICAATGNNEYLYHQYDHKSNGDWRGYKSHIWEGGHREPLIASWPGKIAPSSTSDQLVCLSDFLATCAAVTGAEIPDGAAEDSVNMLPVLLGTASQPVRESLVHHSSFGVFSLRHGKWKAVFDCADSGGWPAPRGSHPEPGTPGQLYDISVDPGETVNLWVQHPEITDQLSAILQNYKGSAVSAPSHVT